MAGGRECCAGTILICGNLKPKYKHRRFQADIPEELSVAIAQVCERLGISKNKFAQISFIQALSKYCCEQPEAAEENLLELLRRSEEHLLD
jgi:hypothetical protein